MGTEMEKKYLLWEDGASYLTMDFFNLFPSVSEARTAVLAQGRQMVQGYMPLSLGRELAALLEQEVDFEPVEARLRCDGGSLYFTMKGKGGLFRNTLPDVPVSQDVFDRFWSGTESARLEKKRLALLYQGQGVEIDVYTDRDLMVAEVEVASLEQALALTPLGKDISENHRYKNRNLAR